MKRTILLTLALLMCFIFKAQVNILNASFSEYNLSKEILSQISLSNNGPSGTGKFSISLVNSSNAPIFTAESKPVQVNTGVNIYNSSTLSFFGFNYSSLPQGQYVKNTNRLSSGAFNYCVKFFPLSGVESSDEYCININSENNEALYLIYPSNEETIETTTPVLTWMHTEAFNLLNEGEFFKITLVEKNEEQSPEGAILGNTPLMVKNRVTTHNIPYPLDAQKLEKGKQYAWQVQKIANGNIIASTEVWTFKISEKSDVENHVYVELKEHPGSSIYYVHEEMIYFRVDERYNSSILKLKIIGKDNQPISDRNDQSNFVLEKKKGYNKYELDLAPFNLKNGYYTLVVENEKQRRYTLKFLIEK